MTQTANNHHQATLRERLRVIVPRKNRILRAIAADDSTPARANARHTPTRRLTRALILQTRDRGRRFGPPSASVSIACFRSEWRRRRNVDQTSGPLSTSRTMR